MNACGNCLLISPLVQLLSRPAARRRQGLVTTSSGTDNAKTCNAPPLQAAAVCCLCAQKGLEQQQHMSERERYRARVRDKQRESRACVSKRENSKREFLQLKLESSQNMSFLKPNQIISNELISVLRNIIQENFQYFLSF